MGQDGRGIRRCGLRALRRGGEGLPLPGAGKAGAAGQEGPTPRLDAPRPPGSAASRGRPGLGCSRGNPTPPPGPPPPPPPAAARLPPPRPRPGCHPGAEEPRPGSGWHHGEPLRLLRRPVSPERLRGTLGWPGRRRGLRDPHRGGNPPPAPPGKPHPLPMHRAPAACPEALLPLPPPKQDPRLVAGLQAGRAALNAEGLGSGGTAGRRRLNAVTSSRGTEAETSPPPPRDGGEDGAHLFEWEGFCASATPAIGLRVGFVV
ncbi:chromosome 13 C11orf52 like C13H11orf52 mRNA [Crotalus adamanteus]|uniref:Chromosome 13 C11orf52 like C13H11orf52 mRNA n=1 Tax=Crotalus adamanteus TaxID=8729 RepID=A0AAW1B0L7_CROAD